MESSNQLVPRAKNLSRGKITMSLFCLAVLVPGSKLFVVDCSKEIRENFLPEGIS